MGFLGFLDFMIFFGPFFEVKVRLTIFILNLMELERSPSTFNNKQGGSTIMGMAGNTIMGQSNMSGARSQQPFSFNALI